MRDLDAAVLCDMETTAQCMARTASSARTLFGLLRIKSAYCFMYGLSCTAGRGRTVFWFAVRQGWEQNTMLNVMHMYA